jgi:hypothetical protein
MGGTKKTNKSSEKAGKDKYKLLNCWEAAELPPGLALEDRRRQLGKIARCSARPFRLGEGTPQTDMPLHEELLVMATMLLFFAIPLWGPLILIWLLYAHLKWGLICLAGCVIVSKIPSPQSTKICYHYLATLTLKYFSFRAIWTTTVGRGSYIGVTPPHGLFPVAGICGVFALPR